MWLKLLKYPIKVTRYPWMVQTLDLLEELIPIQFKEGEGPYDTFRSWWIQVRPALFSNEESFIYWNILEGMD